MTVKIGEKIKELRKKADVTQERFAEYLGVTAQAVSRWEVEGCYPDIELLPSIASFFSITIDELMCFDTMKNREKIESIQKQVQENWTKGLLDENFKILRSAVQEFPNNYSLLHGLAALLRVCYKNDEERQKNLHEAISICERTLLDCTDDEIRYGALFNLVLDYKDIGEKEKAITTAKKLPNKLYTSNITLCHVYEGEELSKHLVHNISGFLETVAHDIDRLAQSRYDDDKDTEKKMKLYKKAIALFELMYEDGDYGFYHCRLVEYYVHLAHYYAILNNAENALDCLEKSAKHAIEYDKITGEYKHTSVIFENHSYDFKNSSRNVKHNQSYSLLHEWGLHRDWYDLIREHERFKAVISELEKYEKKES